MAEKKVRTEKELEELKKWHAQKKELFSAQVAAIFTVYLTCGNPFKEDFKEGILFLILVSLGYFLLWTFAQIVYDETVGKELSGKIWGTIYKYGLLAALCFILEAI